MPVYRGAGGAGDATNDATVTAVQAAATSAATSATNAANSATAAANSATGAATSATNASNSATTAAGQATTAAGHATNASTFATNSSLSADDSADSATEAEGYASEAFNYKVAASLSEGNASDYADAAQASQLAAETAALAVDGVLTDPDFITVLGLSDELQTVAANSANITAVAANNTNITAVATNETNIDLVAANISDIGIVAEKEADIDTVAGIAANVTTVAGISGNVTTVAGISANVTTVATNNANVTTVATNIASVNTNATNIANINQNAANIVAIQNASANATAAAASATAAAGSATSASASAAAASAVALGNEPVRHSVRPSLLLDFANTKTLDPRITFTRASTGTFYDGKTVAKAEENLLQQSETFDNGFWSKQNATVTANASTAPDGTTTADKIVEAATTSFHSVGKASISVSAGDHTASFYAKADGRNWVGLDFNNGSVSAAVFFDLVNGLVGTKDATLTASITSVGSGWYRCVATRNYPSAISTAQFNLFPASADNTGSYAGNGTSGILVWGAQLEQRSSVTAYTATTTAPITNYIPALQTAAAGVARFEHNPVTGESLGLEIEEQRTNLMAYSEQFNDAFWSKSSSSVTPNVAIAPDGTLTADLLIPNTDNVSNHWVASQDRTTVAGVVYTASVFVKAAGYNFVGVALSSTSFAGEVLGVFNLTTGQLSSSNNGNVATLLSSFAQNVGNGWWRLSISSTSQDIAGAMRIMVSNNGVAESSGVQAFAGNGFSGIYIWGAQLEAGAFATSYIPTVASQVTRSADRATMSNIGSLLNVQEGTLYVSGTAPAGGQPSGNASHFAVINDGTNNNRVRITRAGVGTDIIMGVTNGGATQASITLGFLSNNQMFKVVGAYKTNDFSGCLNAATAVTDASGSTPAVLNSIDIGHVTGSALTEINSSISKIAYYPKRLTNQELVGLTTV